MLTLSYIPNCEYLDLLCQFGGKYLGNCLQTLASISVLVMLTMSAHTAPQRHCAIVIWIWHNVV